MTRRHLILGSITVMVVMYGAWDMIHTRSRTRPHAFPGTSSSSPATARDMPVARKDVLSPPSPLPGGDAPGLGDTSATKAPLAKKNAEMQTTGFPGLPRVAGLTPRQRQRAEAEWGRDPFIRGGSHGEGKPKALTNVPSSADTVPTLTLKGTVRFGDRRIAIINDKSYLIGDMVQGWRVEKIGEDSVIIQKGEERRPLALPRPWEVR